MKPRGFSILTACCLWLLAGTSCPVSAQGTKDLTIDGQVKVGVHKLKMNGNSLYQIEVKGKGFVPNVNLQGHSVPNTISFGSEQNTFRGLFFPPKSAEYTLTVWPSMFNPPEGLHDYTVTLKTMKFDGTPLVNKEDKLTADDPRYANPQLFGKTTHFKAYPINMKAGQLYIIDMVASKVQGNKLDPYLYLEAPNKNILARDDDGGGFPNARIMFRAVVDGEHTIIASALWDLRGTGEYTLTVRVAKDD